ADGSFDFTRADIDAKLNRGLAELTKAEIEGTDRLLTLSGLIPYRTGSLALAGSLAERPQEGVAPTSPAISFFVGGSWPEPVISPHQRPAKAACSSRTRCTSRRFVMTDAMMTPMATRPMSNVQAALISGVTPRRTWL